MSTTNMNYHIRSISFPSTQHKTSTRIDEELTLFKTREEDKPICHGISGLIELYKCLNDLLNSPTANKAVFKAENIGRLGFLLDGSVKILDICGITRDLVSQMKESLIDLQSSIRRRKGDLGIETNIAKFISLRKSIAKKAKKLALTLKKDQECCDDQETEHVVKILRQVNMASFRVFESLLAFLGKSKSRSLVVKWMQKGWEENSSNQLEKVDKAIYKVCKGENVVAAMDSLKCLESEIGEMENGLEGLFRQLIRARGSLLNIASQ